MTFSLLPFYSPTLRHTHIQFQLNQFQLNQSQN